MKWYLLAWQRFAKFGGRSRRMEYWMFTLIHLVIFIVLFVAVMVFYEAHQLAAGALMYILLLGYVLASLIPQLACGARRLHDTNRSAWWLLLSLGPIVNLVLIVFFALPGTPGDNQYGPDPKAMQQPTVSG